jgi:methyl-accepting chemotaxis protein
MKNLKVWQKLVLMGLVFLVPFAVVTFKMVSSVNTLGIDFARSERVGIEYALPLQRLLQNVQRHRSASSAALNGDMQAAAQLQTLRADIAKDISDVDAINALQGSVLATQSRWQNLKAECQALVERADTLNLKDSFARHTQVTTNINAFISYIGDVSKLALDPDIDSYYLMSASILQGPELTEFLSELQALGLARSQKQKAAPSQVRETERLAAILGHLLSGFNGSLDKAMNENPRLRVALQEKVQTNSRLVQEFLKVYSQLGPTPSPATHKRYYSTSVQATDALSDLLTLIAPALDGLLEARIQRMQQEVRLTLLWAGLGLLIVTAIGFYVIRDITRPLLALKDAAVQIGSGNLTARVPVRSNDEIGVLSSTFNGMADNLQAINRQLLALRDAAVQIGSGNLDARVEVHSDDEIGVLSSTFNGMADNLQAINRQLLALRDAALQVGSGNLNSRVGVHSDDEVGVLSRGFNDMVGSLQEINRELGEAASTLSSSASQILASTSQVAASASQTAAAITQTTATVEEVKQTAQLSSQKARAVAEGAQRSAEVSQAGNRSVSESIGGMERVREQMTSIAESVINLSEQSQAIGDIINTVNDLAEQSNLLAVNAAIEAAKPASTAKASQLWRRK